jgi:hypothetical protein
MALTEKSSQGWIKLHRRILFSPVYELDVFSRGQAWVDLLLLANHDEGEFRVRGNRIKITRGQLGWSEKNLATRWKWSRGKVARFLNDLEKDQQIVQQKSRLTTIITILNYNEYQGGGQQNEHQIGQQTGQQTEQQTGQQTSINKKERRKEEKNNSLALLDLNVPFDQFWKLYDKKVDMSKCSKLWSKMSDQERLDAISHVPRYVASKPDKQFRKNPATYLFNKSWNDEVLGETPVLPLYQEAIQRTGTQANEW